MSPIPPITLPGSDLSKSNGPDGLAYALKQRFCIVKATEGNGHESDPNCVDPAHDPLVAALRKARVLVGHYHVCHPENDPIAEAEWFVKHAKPQAGDTMWADFEPYYREWSKPQQVAWLPWLTTFVKRVSELSDAVCGVYLNDDMGMRLFSGKSPAVTGSLLIFHPLWKASYAEAIGDTFGFKNVLLWQYDAKDVDKDRLLGDEEAWQVVAVPAKEAQKMKGPQYAGFPVFGYPKLTNTWQIEGFAKDVLTLTPPAGTSVHLLEYDVISSVHANVNSWHYWFDKEDVPDDHALACDVNLFGTTDQEEFKWLLANVYPLARKWGLAVTFPAESNGYGVPGHSIGDGLHCHVDTGSWSNLGRGDVRFAAWNKKLSLPGPKPLVIAPGDTGYWVKYVQRLVGARPVDGIYGDGTKSRVETVQTNLNYVNKTNVVVDGVWGDVTDATYYKFVDGALGEKSITLWQHNAGVKETGKITTELVKAVQAKKRMGVAKGRVLNGKDIDGALGPKTWRMLQDWLNVHVDGIPGPVTYKRLQQVLLQGNW